LALPLTVIDNFTSNLKGELTTYLKLKGELTTYLKLKGELTAERAKTNDLQRRLKDAELQLEAERRLVSALMAEMPQKARATLLAKASAQLLADKK